MRTRVMPRRIVWLTYALAVVMLVGGGSLRPLRFALPVWVLLVSIALLRAAGSEGRGGGLHSMTDNPVPRFHPPATGV
jgi:hypothetical protein